MNHDPLPLAAIEQSLLTHVETTHQALVDAAAEVGEDPTGDECIAMGTYHNHVVSGYAGLLPTAQLLSEAGFTKLAARLSTLILQTRQDSMSWFIAVVKSWKHKIPQAVPQAAPAAAAPAAPVAPSAGEIALQQQKAHFQELERQRALQQAQFDAWQKQHDELQAFYDKQNEAWRTRFKGK